MKKMNVRKLKKRCDVRGCKSLDTFCIARSAELGGVVICEDCLREALAAIENYVEPKKKTDTKPPELFYSSQVIDKPQDVENETLSTEQDENRCGAERKCDIGGNLFACYFGQRSARGQGRAVTERRGKEGCTEAHKSRGEEKDS